MQWLHRVGALHESGRCVVGLPPSQAARVAGLPRAAWVWVCAGRVSRDEKCTPSCRLVFDGGSASASRKSGKGKGTGIKLPLVSSGLEIEVTLSTIAVSKDGEIAFKEEDGTSNIFSGLEEANQIWTPE